MAHLSFSATAIARRNAKFVKMTRPEQRAAIAKDVLSLLTIGKIQAHRGVYFSVDITGIIPVESTALPALCLAQLDNTSCNTCAIGALFASLVLGSGGYKDKVSGYIPTRDEMVAGLNLYFSEYELDVLERYFEDHSRGAPEFPDTVLRVAMNQVIDTGGAPFRIGAAMKALKVVA